ncbi:MAG TPA: hypothetical protein VKA21_12590 [Candidatus Binatia bacterium]|nr:hypothetical protein [Candidatus Binatia bacterium]
MTRALLIAVVLAGVAVWAPPARSSCSFCVCPDAAPGQAHQPPGGWPQCMKNDLRVNLDECGHVLFGNTPGKVSLTGAGFVRYGATDCADLAPAGSLYRYEVVYRGKVYGGNRVVGRQCWQSKPTSPATETWTAVGDCVVCR